MRKLFVLAAVAAVALTAVPAFASVQNVKISGWTDNTYIGRSNFDLGCTNGGGCLANEEQSLFINQTGLQVDADLTDQVFVTIALIGERGWGADGGSSSSSSEVDLHLAYVTLKEMLYSPLTLVIGRQTFSFGNGLVFDATGANNVAPGDSGIRGIAQDLTKQTAIDAIRAIFDYNPLTVTVFYSKIDQNTVGLSDIDDDADLWGVNANYQLGDDMDSLVEAYFYKYRDQSSNNTAGAQTEYTKVTGIRGSTNPLENLNVQLELAHQGGRKHISSAADSRARSAWALQGIVNYQIPMLEEYRPVAQYIFTKVTGDTDNATSQTDYTGWDPFFEAQGGGHIYNALFDLTNMEIHSIYLTAEPMEDVTARLGVTSLWAERNTKFGTKSIRNPDGRTLTLATNNNSGHIGKEFNFDLSYDYTEDVQIGASLGYFLAGSIWDKANDSSAKQVLVNMNVAF